MVCIYYGDCKYPTMECQETNPFIECKYRKLNKENTEENNLSNSIMDVLHYHLGDSKGDFVKAMDTIIDFIKIELTTIIFPENFDATLTTKQLNERVLDQINEIK